jgi:hypothetical protein
MIQLYLSNHPHVILDQSCQILLQIAATVVGYDISPSGRVVEATKIWLKPSRKDVYGGGFPDPILSEQANDTSGARCRETVKLEAILAVSVRDVLVQVRR